MLMSVNSFMSDAYVHALLSVFSFCLFRLQYGFKKMPLLFTYLYKKYYFCTGVSHII